MITTNYAQKKKANTGEVSAWG